MKVGRREIYTNYEEINSENVIDALQRAIGIHNENVRDIQYLFDFEAGEINFDRTKTYRPDIDNRVVDNVAAQVTDFWLGFAWGNPITVVQKGNRWDDAKEEATAIADLNENYTATNYNLDTMLLAKNLLVCGIGYTFIDINDEYEEGESCFIREVLDPRNTFVVKSSYYLDRRPMMGVVRRKDHDGVTFYTVFTNDTQFTIKNYKIENTSGNKNVWEIGNTNGIIKNPLGKIPIVEWIFTSDRTGCFEKQISEMLNLNLLVSDFTNDVDQNTQALIHTNDIELPQEEVEIGYIKDDGTVGTRRELRTRKLKPGEWLMTQTTQDGKKPSIEAVTLNYDYPGMLSNILSRRSLILQKCHVPITTDNTNGATGVAMDAATGWSDAEAVASAREMLTNGCMVNELEVVLEAIKKSKCDSSSPLRKLKICDLKPNVRRPKTYELSIKVNSMATLLSHGFSLEDCVSNIPLFDDPSAVIMSSGDGVRRYQETIFADTSEAEGGEGEKKVTSDRTMSDLSEQVQNSPNIDGQQKQLIVSEQA